MSVDLIVLSTTLKQMLSSGLLNQRRDVEKQQRERTMKINWSERLLDSVRKNIYELQSIIINYHQFFTYLRVHY